MQKTQNATDTMNWLWAAIEEKGDFPTISNAAREIASALRDDESAPGFDLASAVLTDFALTQKVIRLANSAMYAGIGGQVATVSRAIFVLGTETVAHLALGQKFLAHLERTSTGSHLARQELTKVVVAGAVARNVTSRLPTRDSEEAVVSSLVRNLGRLLVAYYLPEKWNLIQQQLESNASLSESAAVEDVLGLGLFAIGRQIGDHWGLPSELLNTMRVMVPGTDSQPLSHADWLVAVASFSSECAEALATPGTESTAVMQQLAQSYSARLGIDTQQLKEALRAAEQDDECQRLLDSKQAEKPEASKPSDAYPRLARGLQDLIEIRNTADASTIASTVLETMQHGMGFKRVFLFLRNGNTKKLAARMTLGPGTREVLPLLQFNEAFEPDVFHLSLAQNQPIIVDNCISPGWKSKLPSWFKTSLPLTRSFLCIPLVTGGVPVAMLYGDWDCDTTKAPVETHELAQLTQMGRVLLEALTRRNR
jgi:HD-like signal output (HDOD) protein